MTDPVLLLKALADPTRLRLVRTLLEAPRYVEELAAALALSAPTVSHHLKKLEAAGVVSRRKDQYYVVYSVRREVLERTLVEVVAEGTETVGAEQQRLDAYRRRILETFIVDGRVRRMPAQRKKRLVVPKELYEQIADYKSVTEWEDPYTTPEEKFLLRFWFLMDHGVSITQGMLNKGVIAPGVDFWSYLKRQDAECES